MAPSEHKFNPRMAFRQAADSAREAAVNIADGASKVADGLAAKTREAADAAGNAARSFADATKNALDSVGTVVAGAADGARTAMDRKATERLESSKREYAPKIQTARSFVKNPHTLGLIDSFADSPLPLIEENAERIKSSFPIPREQTVLWADAEFDLRPSGIALTETGIYIKTDIDPIALDKEKREKSRLYYFPWEFFDPRPFAQDDENNLALSVSEPCRKQFIMRCKELMGQSGHINPLESITGAEADVNSEHAELQASAVAAASTLSNIDALFVEQRALVNNPSGHGELAEEANGIIDKLQGRRSTIVGRDNAKNGADRIVDGAFIQSKYHNSARGSLESCFDPITRQYRYLTDTGAPMQLEVPRDQYQQVVHGFENKIHQGKVPGITDPREAQNIVRQGKLTYSQAVNLTKPGTIESLAYDTATSAVTCSCAFGISFLASSFMAYRETKNIDEAIRAGVAAGVQVFGLSFVQYIMVSQLSRTSLSNVLMAPSRALVDKLGHKASASIVNGLRTLTGKPAISGAAASNHLSKLLRTNAVTAAATLAVFSVPETCKLVQGKASGAQYAQNIAGLATSIAGGIAGTAAAGAAAAKIGAAAGTTVAPGVGTVVGLMGGMVGGTAGTLAANTVGGILFEGDKAAFSRYFNAIVSCMAVEYLLDGTETDALLDALDHIPAPDFNKLFEEVFPAERQEEKMRAFLAPYFDEVASHREHFMLPKTEQITETFAELENALEELEAGNTSDATLASLPEAKRRPAPTSPAAP